jgi:hypothetical protein
MRRRLTPSDLSQVALYFASPNLGQAGIANKPDIMSFSLRQTAGFCSAGVAANRRSHEHQCLVAAVAPGYLGNCDKYRYPRRNANSALATLSLWPRSIIDALTI